MVATEPADVTASEARPAGFRIRWGWFLGCVASGLVAIVVGWFVAAPAGRMNYLAGVLVNVGTTLLLVGIVVLLERRIVGAVRGLARCSRMGEGDYANFEPQTPAS